MASLLTPVFDNFMKQAPLAVMMGVLMENVCGGDQIDEIFEETASQQYTRDLQFSTVADLLSCVVFDRSPSIGAAYQSSHEAMEVSRKSIYNKLNGVEPAVSEALVEQTAGSFEAIIGKLDARLPSLLPGYRVRILDGNHLSASEHRLKELRTVAAAPLPGKSLVVFEPSTKLATTVIACEDGHAQERALLSEVLRLVDADDLWIADRNFCTTAFLTAIDRVGACFLVRQHAGLTGTLQGERIHMGRCATGEVYEQAMTLQDPQTDEAVTLRRISIELDKPVRGGQRELHLLSNVPTVDASAAVLADLYRKRWRIETMFQELTETLCCEIKPLGYPRAALLAFSLAVVAYNVIAVIKASLRTVHGSENVEQNVSGYYIALEISSTYGGMMIAVPEEHWSVFRDQTPTRIAAVLKKLAANAKLAKYQKHPRGPKKPKPKRIAGNSPHVATSRILEQRKSK